jgi:hypothetical protein
MFDWSKTEAIIPAVVSIPERRDSLIQLITDLSIQCPGISAKIIPQWKARPGCIPRTAFESIHKGLEGISCPWVFYLEEDIELSPKFGEVIPSILNAVDEKCGAVSFFSTDSNIVPMYRASPPFNYSQCVAIRLEVARSWGNTLLNWWDNAPRAKRKGPDICFGECCDNLGVDILVYTPSLVQHRYIPSGFGHNARIDSGTFIGRDNGNAPIVGESSPDSKGKP